MSDFNALLAKITESLEVAYCDWENNTPIDFEGNAPAALGDCSPEAYKASNWIIAIDAWDYCDPSLLNEMLNRHPIPFELQPVIADIITGQRKQNKKAAAKLKIPAGHRLIYAGLYADLKSNIIDATLQRKTLFDYHDTADNKGIEVKALQKIYREGAKEFESEWANIAGISIETLKSIRLDLSRKIKNYPNI